MGTFVSIAVHDRGGDRLAEAVEQAFDEVRAVDALMSTFRPDSQISRLNRAAGREPMAVDPRVAEVLRAARHTGEQSGGVFDVTVLPLLRAFGLRQALRDETDKDSRGSRPGRAPHRPTPEALLSALGQVDYRTIAVDTASNSAGLAHSGTTIDLGGIAKGYAVDRAAEVLRARGVRQAVINAGGDLRVLGAPGHGHGGGWRVGIADPLQPSGILATLEVRDQAIATSGNYEQFVEVDDERFGHLIDPRSGRPAEAMLSATVVAATAMQADAASTTAFLMGPELGAHHILEMSGADFVFVGCAGRFRASEGPKHESAEGPALDSAGSEDGIEIHTSPGISGLAMSA
jgi:thiamine biosynthesis lipoprotein